MAVVYKLPAKLLAALDQVRADLETFIEEQQEARDEKSEKWREGDKGQEHDDWLNELQTLVEALTDAPKECG